MSKKNTGSEKVTLSEKKLKALAEWLKSNGSEAFRPAFENKSEVEKIIDRMSLIDEKIMKEPYTL